MGKNHPEKENYKNDEWKDGWYIIKIIEAEYWKEKDDEECIGMDCIILEKYNHLYKEERYKVKNNKLSITIGSNSNLFLLIELYDVLNISEELDLEDLSKLLAGKKVKNSSSGTLSGTFN